MKVSDTPTWIDTYKKTKKYPSLKENLEVDVAIIGGGITGVTTAYLLSRAARESKVPLLSLAARESKYAVVTPVIPPPIIATSTSKFSFNEGYFFVFL